MVGVVAMANEMMALTRETRSKYHVTLGELHSELSILLDKGYGDAGIVAWDEETAKYLGDLDSYRGYYDDIAIEPTDEPSTVRELFENVDAAIDTTMTGYKGGEYLMTADTPVWISDYGSASGMAVIAIMINDLGLGEGSGTVFLMTRKID